MGDEHQPCPTACKAWPVHWPHVLRPALPSATTWASPGTLEGPTSRPRSRPRDPGTGLGFRESWLRELDPPPLGGSGERAGRLHGAQVPNSPSPSRQSSRVEQIVGPEALYLSLTLDFQTREEASHIQAKCRPCREVMTPRSPTSPRVSVRFGEPQEGGTDHPGVPAGWGEEVNQGWGEYHRQSGQRAEGWGHRKVQDLCGASRGDLGASREVLAEHCSPADGRWAPQTPPRRV